MKASNRQEQISAQKNVQEREKQVTYVIVRPEQSAFFFPIYRVFSEYFSSSPNRPFVERVSSSPVREREKKD